MKFRIKADFCKVTFHQPNKKNTIETVYFETLQTGAVFEKLHSDSYNVVTLSSETDCNSSSPETRQMAELYQTHFPLSTTY